MRLSRKMVLALVVATIAALAVVANAAVLAPSGRVGPALHLLGNGRMLTPQGKLVALGNFPTGGALSNDGRFYWTISTGRGLNDIRIVSLRTGKVIQTLPLPGASGGIAMDPRSRIAYVSGVADSGHKDEQRVGAPGRGGDVIHVFAYDASGSARFTGLIGVPPPSGTPDPQNFPPQDTVGKPVSWPDRLAVSGDGKRLLVPLNLADAAAVVDVASKSVRYVNTGTYPYGAAILRDGKTGLVSNEAPGSVSVINLDSATKVKDIQVGPHLSHPEAIAVDPRADRAYVALANSDQVVVIDTKKLAVERTLSVAREEGDGTSPVDVTVTPDGSYLLAAEAGADELAVFKLPASASASASSSAARVKRKPVAVSVPADFSLVGRIPVASYADDVKVAPAGANACARPSRVTKRHTRSRGRRRKPATRHCAKLVWIAGKGLGVGPNPSGPNPYVINDNNSLSQNYLPTIVNGTAGVLDFPSVARIRALTAAASLQVRPANGQAAPADTPLRPGGPIKHVFYIVRENRTYDQILGDDSRGDGDPNLALFGRQVTPNVHALVQRFPLLDHVYANSEASIDGHFWTSAAKVSDYVHKNWNQNYGDRKRPYDFGVFSITWPSKGFLFDQAERQGIPYFNFGEAIAGNVPLTDKDRTPEETAASSAKLAKSDLGAPQGCYANDAFLFKNALTQNPVSDSSPPAGAAPNTESRFDCFKQRFTVQLATSSVPAFTYIVLPQDHTQGATPGQFSPRAYVANNDYGLGQTVDLISHSAVWKDSAIFVIEDDSQDGADHVDAHRMPAAVISPYAKRGAIVHTRYDMLSVIKSMELILGMKPLGLFDNLATPMYDAFQSTPANDEAYNAISPTYNLTEKNPATAASARMTHGLNLQQPDRVSQRALDRQIYKTIYGPNAKPPPPGPNAAAGQ